MDVTTFQRDARARLDEARAALERFLALPADASFEDVVGTFDAIGRPLNEVGGIVSIFSAVHPDSEMRDAADELERELSAFQTELSLRRDAYERLDALAPADAPDDEARRYLEHALRDYRRGGVDRDEATRERVRALHEELVRIGQEFDRNIVQDVREVRFEDGATALEGLPGDYVRSHPVAEDGSVTVTTDPPDYVPFVTFARSGAHRRRLYREYVDRAWPQNGKVLDRLLAKRHELATLLGYPSWAAFVTEDKMVRSPEAARAFVERVAALARPRAEAEYHELLDAKRREEPDAEAVGEYERLYWVERVKRDKHRFDSQEARPYFPYDSVLAGVLETSAELYGVTFRRDEARPVWHESVRCYEVLDGDRVVALAYFDMHPRAGKFKHAAVFDLHTGVGERIPAACLVCNFPRPKGDDPALLLHDQVTTIFHEVGHMLHHLFASRSRYLRFGGISTEWDFVEVPSQMYEEWAWDHGVLQRFARHHETGEPIPAELVERMRAADEYGKALQVTVQMLYATLSLTYYDRDPAGLDTTEVMKELKARMVPFPHEEGTHFQAAFGHLHGYSAMYYTYMWSLVIAKDLFSRFERDLLDREVARRYREVVLAPGGMRDAVELVREFLGRDYEFAAYERWLSR